MGLNWLWQGLVTELLARNPWVGVAVAGVVGMLALLLKMRGSRWAEPIVYGVVAAAAVVVGLYVYTAWSTIAKLQPPTTLETVETNIRT